VNLIVVWHRFELQKNKRQDDTTNILPLNDLNVTSTENLPQWLHWSSIPQHGPSLTHHAANDDASHNASTRVHALTPMNPGSIPLYVCRCNQTST
jgi:hypothetical protein